MVQKKTKNLIDGAVIAALYVILTYLADILGLASGVIQVRISEALNVMVCFTASAVPGLTVGCFLSNLLTGGALPDVIFGTLATLIGAFGGYLLRKNRVAALACPILSNAVIVPFVLKLAYGMPDAFWFIVVTVTIGELVSCGVLGYLLGLVMDKYARRFHQR